MEQGARSGSGPFRNQQHTPTARSHAAYYHAVSNYHYSYNSNPNEDQGSSSRAGGGSSSQVNRCAPIGHYAVPDNWQWRRQRGRVMSQQSYGSGNGNFSGAGNGARRGHGEGREDHWLWGM
ncbi:hypothetical protein FBU30_009224 [Linnemannia zychae]|nr:hypothetical protein FBU30_009224 [Linnemannia zychae]